MKDGTLVYGTPGYKSPPLGTGVVTLSEIELTHVGAGEKAEVQSLVFTADITLPPAREGRRQKASEAMNPLTTPTPNKAAISSRF